MPMTSNIPGIASASISETLKALDVNPKIGLTHVEVDNRRKDHGYNEVAEQKKHPVLMFIGKFWGVSAWMLELIIILSAILGKFSDLVIEKWKPALNRFTIQFEGRMPQHY